MPMHPWAFASLIAASVVVAALPQASAPAPAPAPVAAADVPKHSCPKLGEWPGRLASERQQRTWQREVDAYSDCMKRFAESQRVLAELHMNSANATIAEYNAAVKAVNDQVLKASQ